MRFFKVINLKIKNILINSKFNFYSYLKKRNLFVNSFNNFFKINKNLFFSNNLKLMSFNFSVFSFFKFLFIIFSFFFYSELYMFILYQHIIGPLWLGFDLYLNLFNFCVSNFYFLFFAIIKFLPFNFFNTYMITLNPFQLNTSSNKKIFLKKIPKKYLKLSKHIYLNNLKYKYLVSCSSFNNYRDKSNFFYIPNLFYWNINFMNMLNLNIYYKNIYYNPFFFNFFNTINTLYNISISTKIQFKWIISFLTYSFPNLNFLKDINYNQLILNKYGFKTGINNDIFL